MSGQTGRRKQIDARTIDTVRAVSIVAPMSIEQDIVAAAKSATSVWEGSDKRWICHVMEALAGRYTREQVATALVAMQRARKIDLARCDLVEACPARLVDASLVEYRPASWMRAAEFHFVRVGN